MEKQKNTKLTAILLITVLMTSALVLITTPLQAQVDQDISHGTPHTADRPGVSGSPPADANITWNFDVEARLAASPSPIGVNQVFTVNCWVTPPPSAERFMKDYKIQITKPSGEQTVVTMDSYVADGTAWFPYLADEIGEWKIQFIFIGMYHPPGWYNDGEYQTEQFSGAMWYDGNYYKPQKSQIFTLIVQEEFVYSWPLVDLPTDYWTRPISLEQRGWAEIAGNYPWKEQQSGSEYSGKHDYYGPYIKAPDSSHVVWKVQRNVAGIVGGEAEGYGALGNAGTPDVIYMGRCYETYNKPGVGNVAACYDLRTGEIYYEIPTSEGGVTPQWIAYDKPADTAVPGAGSARPITAYLIGVDSTSNARTLYKINPYTGVASSYNITGAGRILAFRNDHFLSIRDSNNAQIQAYMEAHYWNNTDLNVKNGYPTYLYNWTVLPNTQNIESRINSNITYRLCPSYRGSGWPLASRWNWYGYFGTADIDTGITVNTRRFFDNGVWGGSAVGVSIITGDVLWERHFTNAPYSPRTTVARDGVVVIPFNQGEVVGLDMKTGAILWTNKNNSYPFGGFWGYDEATAYGMAYFWGYDGVQAYDLETGVHAWHYNDVAVPFETTYYGADGELASSFNGNGIVADGKVYTRNSEHTPTAPYTRGWSLHCLDAFTGELIWKIGNPMNPGAAADGYLTASNSYDGFMYVFGKGKSETTVTAPLSNVAKGSSITITGTVLDLAPAQTGTPCVSIDSMDVQMDYLHLQRPIGGLFNNETIQGVPVTLSALHQDGSFVDLGVTTTDGYYGTYGISWTPEKEGIYQIIASFAGSDAYGSSADSTYVAVGPQAASYTPTEPKSETTLISTEAAIIIVVAVAAIAAVVSFLVYKKRK